MCEACSTFYLFSIRIHHLYQMRSFNVSADKYSIQHEYNTKKDNMAEVLMPSCQLRLMNLTGLEVEGSLDQNNNEIVGRDGFFHMNACNEALNALDRCGWKRSFHQRTTHQLNPIL
jgi:hypothetical protein